MKSRLIGFAFVSFLLLFTYWSLIMFIRGEWHRNPLFALSLALFITLLTVLGSLYILTRKNKTRK